MNGPTSTQGSFELSVNIEYGFTEAGADLADRVAAAAAAGFDRVELFTTSGRDLAVLDQALKEHGVALWTVVADPRTQLVDPGTHGRFREIFRDAATDAKMLGCSRVVVGSGPAVPYRKRKDQLATVAEAVTSVLPIAEELDVTILLEAVNTRHDHPGVLFSETRDTLAVLRAVDSPRVRLLYDLYHSVVEGESPETVLPEVRDVIGHVQVADAPGRGEPGSGKIDWPRQLELLRSIGYAGVIGIECQPTRAPTGEALAWFRDLVRNS